MISRNFRKAVCKNGPSRRRRLMKGPLICIMIKASNMEWKETHKRLINEEWALYRIEKKNLPELLTLGEAVEHEIRGEKD